MGVVSDMAARDGFLYGVKTFLLCVGKRKILRRSIERYLIIPSVILIAHPSRANKCFSKKCGEVLYR